MVRPVDGTDTDAGGGATAQDLIEARAEIEAIDHLGESGPTLDGHRATVEVEAAAAVNAIGGRGVVQDQCRVVDGGGSGKGIGPAKVDGAAEAVDARIDGQAGARARDVGYDLQGAALGHAPGGCTGIVERQRHGTASVVVDHQVLSGTG
ncbi:hypothetical protein GCM10023213_18130 [Prosthecobacter algae]|uniref:Uncharacterized protein n=1 Tax=Prosthecobacter algae TaxID=1144682 RepID=A0ABP9P4H1_9BACT